jgi:hypothetical protein
MNTEHEPRKPLERSEGTITERLRQAAAGGKSKQQLGRRRREIVHKSSEMAVRSRRRERFECHIGVQSLGQPR